MESNEIMQLFRLLDKKLLDWEIESLMSIREQGTLALKSVHGLNISPPIT